MTVSAHTSRVVVDGIALEPTQLSLNLDEGRMPHAVADLTAKAPDAAALAHLDPRQGARVHLSMEQRFGASEPLSAISEDYAGQTIEEMEIEPGHINDDPGFESGVVGWSPSEAGTTIAHSDVQVHTGNFSLEVTNPAGSSAAAWTTDMFPIESLVAWIRAAWIYPTTALSLVSLRAYFYDALGVEFEWVGTARANPTIGEWTRLGPARLNVFGVETENYRFARLEVRLTGTNPHAYVDDVTLRYGRGALSSFSAQYGEPYNSDGFRPSTRVRANLWLRSRAVDYLTGEITLTAASGEALLADHALVQDVPLSPVGTTIRDCVNMVLEHVLGVSLEAGITGAQEVEVDALAWQPGETGWAYLSGVVGSGGLRLWCDELGRFHLEDPFSYTVPGTVSLSAEDNLKNLTDRIDRETGQWAEAVVVRYRWDDASGDVQTRYDIAGPADASRVIVVEIDRPYPGIGLAAARLRRAKSRGLSLVVDAVASYDGRPLNAAMLTHPDGSIQSGYVSAIAWSQPEDRMSVRTRDVATVVPGSWLETPSGVPWTDIDTGVTWTEYRTPSEEL